MDMETCAGCGAPLAPTWKYCVHCGIAVADSRISGAIRPGPVATHSNRGRNRALLIAGIGVFLVAIALLIDAIIMVTSAQH
jgi:hypothetical protein